MKSPQRQRAKSRVVKRSMVIDGRKTSISLENEFFDALKAIAKKRGTTLRGLVAAIKAERLTSNLSSDIRVFVIEYYEARLPRA
jgi:predicted DNA-binding ribbon-helix-helix protein